MCSHFAATTIIQEQYECDLTNIYQAYDSIISIQLYIMFMTARSGKNHQQSYSVQIVPACLINQKVERAIYYLQYTVRL